tara:strand:- start:22507 stop:22971 length:465 start_codon:yes stop_codon:yes gene_type:complete
MRYIILLSIIFLTLTGCKSTKDIKKNEEARQLTENSKTITKRIGDTVHYKVPNIIFKDTIITIKNKQGTTQVLKYNSEGRLTETECLSSVIEIIQENNRILIENINKMDKHKETEISASIILYFFIGLALFLVIIFTVAFYVLKKYLKTVIPVI